MIRKPRITTLACAVAIAALPLAACRREQPQPMPEPAAPATVIPPAPATVAMPATIAAPMGVAESAAPGEHTAFDAKAFAGSFSAAGTKITFDADGSYTMRVHAQSANADLDSDGTWTLESDTRHVLLDPASKDEPDRRYEVTSMDELRPDDGGVALHREGTH